MASLPGITTVSPGLPNASNVAAVCVDAIAIRGFVSPGDCFDNASRRCSPNSWALPKRRDNPLASSRTTDPICSKRGVNARATSTSAAAGSDGAYKATNTSDRVDNGGFGVDGLRVRPSGRMNRSSPSHACNSSRALMLAFPDHDGIRDPGTGIREPGSGNRKSARPVPGSRIPDPDLQHNRAASRTACDRQGRENKDGSVAALNGALDAEPGRGRQTPQGRGRDVDEIDHHHRAHAGLHDEIQGLDGAIDDALQEGARAIDGAHARQPRRINRASGFRYRLAAHP